MTPTSCILSKLTPSATRCGEWRWWWWNWHYTVRKRQSLPSLLLKCTSSPGIISHHKSIFLCKRLNPLGSSSRELFFSRRVATVAEFWGNHSHLSCLWTVRNALSKPAPQWTTMRNYRHHQPFQSYFMSVGKITITKDFSKKKHLCHFCLSAGPKAGVSLWNEASLLQSVMVNENRAHRKLGTEWAVSENAFQGNLAQMHRWSLASSPFSLHLHLSKDHVSSPWHTRRPQSTYRLCSRSSF